MNNPPKSMLKTLRAKKFGVIIKNKDLSFKIFDIKFHRNSKNQFGIFVNFPYFSKNRGILSKLTFPANTRKVDRMSLTKVGKLVTHLVKYSHWEDGNTHFSQDGRILTKIKNLSNPLNCTADHIFTVMFQDLKGFKNILNYKKELSNNKIDIDFIYSDDLPHAIKITGWWFEDKDINQNKKIGGPQVIMKINNTYKSGILISPPDRYKYSNFALFIAIEKLEFLTKEKGTHLSFIGGFDPKRIFNDFTKDLHFISFIYPVRGYDKLITQIENIDYIGEMISK